MTETTPAEPPQKLCPPCRVESDRWLDTTPSTLIPRFVQRAATGYGYDATPSGVLDSTRAHYEDWRRTVNFQRALIARICQQEDHTTLEAS